ncbi:MAG: phosphate acyltransferase PlsX [Planctomycetota bacterium]
MEAAQRIALDVMGGDHAPAAVLDGVRLVLDGGIPAERLLLVGDEAQVRAGLAERGIAGCDVLHAPEVIGMDEKPGVALRAKPRSSIALATGAVKQGLAGAHVSMGNTGAVVGAATVGLKTLEGVRRPGIAITADLGGQPLTLLDMGANTAPKPEHLVQYGAMGTALAREVVGVATPRVGLLNIGEEASKGTDFLRESHDLLAASGQNFIGNVEGGDLFRGVADVIVTDGFTGNVVLKLMEGFAEYMLKQFGAELAQRGAPWARECLGGLARKVDYAEYGGALLLGVQGVVVIGHGRSDGRAVANAIRFAARALDARVNDAIVRGLAARTDR